MIQTPFTIASVTQHHSFDIYLPLDDCPFNTEAGKATALAIPWYPLLCCAIIRDFDSGSSSSVDTVITGEKKKNGD